MNISVIISTRNRKGSLVETLQVLFYQQNYPLENTEVIVIDDGNVDLSDLYTLFKGKKFCIVKCKGKGLAAARNTGANLACNELLLFLDDDILVTENHLLNHVKAHELYTNSVVTAHRLDSEKLRQVMSQSSFGRYKAKHDYIWYEGCHKMIPLGNNYYEMDGLAGFSCSLLKDDYLKIGEFNEIFPHAGNEDLEFYMRAAKMGYKLVFDKNNICYHNELFNTELHTFLKRHYEGAQSLYFLCKFFPEKKNKIYYQSSPLTVNDSFLLITRKIIVRFISINFISAIIKRTILFCEKSKVSDIVIFKLYNALYISSTYKGFRQVYGT